MRECEILANWGEGGWRDIDGARKQDTAEKDETLTS